MFVLALTSLYSASNTWLSHTHIGYFETLQVHYFSQILISIIQSQVDIYTTYDIVLISFPFSLLFMYFSNC